MIKQGELKQPEEALEKQGKNFFFFNPVSWIHHCH
jgi:hypothetical protein